MTYDEPPSVLSVDSVAHPGWDGRVENSPLNHSPRNSRMNQKKLGSILRLARQEGAENPQDNEL